jgi:hypothetical protein
VLPVLDADRRNEADRRNCTEGTTMHCGAAGVALDGCARRRWLESTTMSWAWRAGGVASS